MMPLLPEQIESLRQLQELCRGFGADVAIIGAVAYRVWVDDPHRQTEDLDLAVALDFPEFEALTHALSGLGWRQDAGREQRWHSPQGGRLDLLPAGERSRKQGWVEWPRSGMRTARFLRGGLAKREENRRGSSAPSRWDCAPELSPRGRRTAARGESPV